MRSIYTSTAPSVEPVTLEEAKLFCRVDTSDDDSLITALITAARQASENYTGRAYINQGITYVTDTSSLFIPLPKVPFGSVSSVRYLDTNNAWQTMTLGSDYDVTTRGEAGVVTLISVPSVDARGLATVEVIFTAGYGAAASSVPYALKQAILFRVAAMYERRGEPTQGTTVEEATLLERPYKVMTVGAGA